MGVIIIIFNLITAFKAYCAMWVRRSIFRHLVPPRVSPRENTQRRKVELWARNVREFCLNTEFHVTFRDFLHAVKLRHGTIGFASPPKENSLRIFFTLKIRRLQRTRELGYQRPACYVQTTEAASTCGFLWMLVLRRSLKDSGNYVYHHIWHWVTIFFVHIMYYMFHVIRRIIRYNFPLHQ
jgi:hypothetical protein